MDNQSDEHILKALKTNNISAECANNPDIPGSCDVFELLLGELLHCIHKLRQQGDCERQAHKAKEKGDQI